MGCTAKTVRCQLQPNGLLPPCCQQKLRDLLQYTHELLTEYRITHWLDYGTMLGAVRGGDLIPWDTDADMGILLADAPRLVALRQTISNARHTFTTHWAGDMYRINYSPCNLLHVDLFPWYRFGSMLGRRHYIKKDVYKGRDFPVRWLKHMGSAAIRNAQYPVPGDPRKFAAFRFGPEWQTPQRRDEGYAG